MVIIRNVNINVIWVVISNVIMLSVFKTTFTNVLMLGWWKPLLDFPLFFQKICIKKGLFEGYKGQNNDTDNEKLLLVESHFVNDDDDDVQTL